MLAQASTRFISSKAAATFTAYDTSHLTAIGILLVGIALLIWAGRRFRLADPQDRLGKALAVVTLGLTVPLQILYFTPTYWDLQKTLPIQLCDLASFVAVYALWTHKPWAVGLVYYWGLTLTTQAIITPDLASAFPDPVFILYWGMHLIIVWAAVYLVWGQGLTPTWRTYAIAVAVTAVWAVTVYVFNVVVGTNYGYLNAKPSSASPLSAQNMLQAYIDAGVPKGVVNLVMGPGETVGQALQDHPGIDGIVFTGSYAVGMQLFRTFSKTWPRPCIVEMGGKNPAIVTRNADLDEAAEGIMRSAFGFGGQKCSANSRVYVERPVHDELVRLLVEKTESIVVGDPVVRENWLGPIIDQRAVDRHQQAVSEARRDGRVLIGGERLSDGDKARGYYVEPTVVGGLPADHRVFRDEFFAPLTAVHAVDSLDEALTLANDTVYGLTAGVYSEDQGEVQQFLDRIQAGVLYVNRRAGATTGAWPGIQAFGGWKGSGSTGKAGLSMYYVAQFMREQSHTVVD